MHRIGFGFDAHKFSAETRLVLGGVEIPFEFGLKGHSDADVLAHAVTDAILGAAALGNIGQLFPDTDPQYKGADSLDLLRRALELTADAGYVVVNLDSTIVAQRPKLNPHIDAMRTRLSECLGIDTARISVKAKTNEAVGPEGREEAISAQAVVLLESSRVVVI